jgi:hypothetical protein
MTDLLWALARPPKPTFFRSWPTAVAPRWRASTACWRPAAAATWCAWFVRLWLAPTRCVSHCARGIAASVRLLARPSPGADEQGWRPAMRDNASSPLALAAAQVWRMRRPRAKGTQEIWGPFANGAARDRCTLHASPGLAARCKEFAKQGKMRSERARPVSRPRQSGCCKSDPL